MSKLPQAAQRTLVTLSNTSTCADAGAVLEAFYERFAPQLNRADLEWLSGANSQVSIMASNWSEILTEKGSLTLTDPSSNDANAISTLLFESANAFNTIRGLSHVASNASYQLRNFEAFKTLDNA